MGSPGRSWRLGFLLWRGARRRVHGHEILTAVDAGQGRRPASLYNRHRPRSFGEMVGQEHVARALGNAIATGRVVNAYLFSGPRGTGKTTTARILARCLNCLATPEPTAAPCGVCDSCVGIGHEGWLDVVEVDAASSARRIDEMRDWLETIRYAPSRSRYRITIMDEAHQIQDSAASALLKTLEEPPDHLVVMLCTTHPWDILDTIRSRTQHYVLRKPGVANLVRVLDRVARAESIETSEAALDLVARAADGSYRDALGLLDQIASYAGGRLEVADVLDLLGAVARETLFELVELLAAGDSAGAFELLASTLDAGADPEQLMRGLMTQLRYLCLLQQGAHARDEWALAPDELERLRGQANHLAAARVVRGLDLLADAQVRIRYGGADPRLQLELVAAKLGRPALDGDAGALAARLEALEAGAVGRGAPAAGAEGSSAPERAAATAPAAPAEAAEAAAVRSLAPAAGVGAQDEPLADGTAAPVSMAEPPLAHEPVALDRPHLERLWPQVLAELKEEAPHLHGFLTGSRVSGLAGTQVQVAMHDGVGFALLRQPDERRRIERALSRLAHRDLTVALEALPASEAPAPDEQRAEAPQGPVDHRTLMEDIKSQFDAVEER